MKVNESLLVGLDFTDDTGVLIVGKKRPNQSVEIINAFQGEKAKELYLNLIGEKNENDI